MQIDVKQIKNFPDLPTKEQVGILYDLVLRLIAQQQQIGLPITDNVLLSILPQALESSNSQLNSQNLPLV